MQNADNTSILAVLAMVGGPFTLIVCIYLWQGYRTIGRLLETVTEQNGKLERLAQAALAYKASGETAIPVGPAVLNRVGKLDTEASDGIASTAGQAATKAGVRIHQGV